MKSYVSLACDYRSPLQRCREIRSGLALLQAHLPPPPKHYYVLVLRGKPVQQRSANSKVIHQQNEIINVINACSHTSIFCCLEIGLGGVGPWVGGGVGAVGVVVVGGGGLIFLTSGNCQSAGGFSLAFIKSPNAVSTVAPRCLG